MSRGLDRDETRPSTTVNATTPAGRADQVRPRGSTGGGRTIPGARGHAQPRSGPPRPLPSGRNPTRLRYDGRSFDVRGSQSRVLQTLATFRVVFERDLLDRGLPASPLADGPRSCARSTAKAWSSARRSRPTGPGATCGP